MRILLAQLNPTIGDLSGNTRKILDTIALGKKRSADIVLFPELCLSGYPPEDFLLLSHFTQSIEKHLQEIIDATTGITAVVGVPRLNPHSNEKPLYNSAAIIHDGTLLGYQDKALLPTYDVFDERRYFEPAHEVKIWDIGGKRVAVTICEDIWQHSEAVKFASYHRDPILDLKAHAPDIILNLSASPYHVSRFLERLPVCAKASTTLNCPMLFCNQVGGNDSLIFDGYSFCVDAKGNLIDYAKGFEEDALLIDLSNPATRVFEEDTFGDLYRALVLGLRDYFHKSGFSRACLGLSGGIDSALVACIATEALGKENILVVAMPSRYSSESSVSDAKQLAHTLGIEIREIPIEEPFQSFLNLLEPHFEGKPADATEENLQARIRGIVMMALSNKLGHIVLSTGNKSELAMGYATLYGDMCGGVGVISDVTKQQVYTLARWINREHEIIPWNTIEKPPSAELRPNQKDSDTLPDYVIIDNVVKGYVEEHLSPEEIASKFDYPFDLVMDLVSRIHRNEYKRRQSAPGLRISEKAFSIGRCFPIVQRWVK